MTGVRETALVIGVATTLILTHGGNSAMSNPKAQDDRSAILAHIDGLFHAYFRKDREAIRRGHTADWRGFQIGSRTLVRGIDEYMKAADRVLETIEARRYQLLDSDVRVYGDVAVVYYLAREWIRTSDGEEKTIVLRSCDIYRREADGWNQCGSHITLAPPDDVVAPPKP